MAVVLVACSTEEVGINEQERQAISYGKEVSVVINGWTFDAMEPFISPDGETLFYNSLNDGINTKIYFAEKVNDSVFNYAGELKGVNQENPPHLDAVPDMDIYNNFFWTSTRNYPAELDNLFYGVLVDGTVTNIGRLQGDFYKNIPGWIVMDHGVSTDGQHLYYNNARFSENDCQGPCEAELGIAQKINESTFETVPGSSLLLENVNNPDYIIYAPHISSDDLELYFSRYLQGTLYSETKVEICVAVRTATSAPFSKPLVLFSGNISNIVEAPSLTLNKNIMYYHRKADDVHKIVMRYRNMN